MRISTFPKAEEGREAVRSQRWFAGLTLAAAVTAAVFASVPAQAAAVGADGDLTGDGIPDLVTPGGPGTGLASGLWLASGKAAPGGTTGSGKVVTPATNIGADGDGFSSDESPASWDGAQVITGLFGSNGDQAVLVYYASGTFQGEGSVINGNGDGGILDPFSGQATAISSAVFTSADPNGDVPLQVADGYNADPDDEPGLSDLITISGDASNGYYLEYYLNAAIPGSWIVSDVLSNPTPDGTMDWNNWRITTMQEPSGAVDMFLDKSSAHTLYLWRNLTVDDTLGTADFTQYELSRDWKPGSLSELRAADITGSAPALWAVTTSAKATAWIVHGLAGTPSVTARRTQSLTAP
jgi:hypothetical protein